MCPRSREKNDRSERTVRVFYCPEAAPFAPDAGDGERTLPLSADESHHALHVLRLRSGDPVCLFDGRGRFFDAVITEAGRRQVSVRIDAYRESGAEAKTRLILLVALLKGRKSDLLVQKATELGVGEILFYPAEHSVARSRAGEESATLQRWEKVVIAACKQSRRATLMPVRICPSLAHALETLPSRAARFVFCAPETGGTARPSPDAPAGNAPADSRQSTSEGICALIGPEGGLTSGEVEQARQAGFAPRSLGPRILRAETAALAAAAVLLHEAGELGETGNAED